MTEEEKIDIDEVTEYKGWEVMGRLSKIAPDLVKAGFVVAVGAAALAFVATDEAWSAGRGRGGGNPGSGGYSRESGRSGGSRGGGTYSAERSYRGGTTPSTSTGSRGGRGAETMTTRDSGTPSATSRTPGTSGSGTSGGKQQAPQQKGPGQQQAPQRGPGQQQAPQQKGPGQQQSGTSGSKPSVSGKQQAPQQRSGQQQAPQQRSGQQQAPQQKGPGQQQSGKQQAPQQTNFRDKPMPQYPRGHKKQGHYTQVTKKTYVGHFNNHGTWVNNWGSYGYGRGRYYNDVYGWAIAVGASVHVAMDIANMFGYARSYHDAWGRYRVYYPQYAAAYRLMHPQVVAEYEQAPAGVTINNNNNNTIEVGGALRTAASRVAASTPAAEKCEPKEECIKLSTLREVKEILRPTATQAAVTAAAMPETKSTVPVPVKPDGWKLTNLEMILLGLIGAGVVGTGGYAVVKKIQRSAIREARIAAGLSPTP